MEELMAKYLADELSEKDRADFESELIQNEQLAAELEAYANVFAITSTEERTFDTEQAWTRASQRVNEAKVVHMRKQPKYSFLKIAAVLLVIAVAGYFAFNATKTPVNQNTIEGTVLVSSNKGIKEYKLPDGSLLKMNANTKVVLAEGFGVKNRNLNLEGEANFDVTRNESLPFVITAGNSRVKVLGTSFNLTTYPDEDIQLNVTEGTVEFASAVDENVKEQVTKGQVAKMDREGKRIRKDRIKDANFSGWWTRRLVFDNTPLPEALEYIEDTYWVTFKYDKETFKNCPISGIYENRPLSEILLSISPSFPDFKYEIKENQIKLEGKPCTD